jgi:hypothetical protein
VLFKGLGLWMRGYKLGVRGKDSGLCVRHWRLGSGFGAYARTALVSHSALVPLVSSGGGRADMRDNPPVVPPVNTRSALRIGGCGVLGFWGLWLRVKAMCGTPGVVR